MHSMIRRSLVASGVLALLTGCTGGTGGSGSGTTRTGEAKPSSAPTSAGGYGDILVDGKPVTGSKAIANTKFPYQRTYTDGELYAPVTGYRTLMYGTTGLESVYDDALAKRSEDVMTTVDPAVQKAAFAALGDARGAAIALDAKTGALLAVVSTPSYDATKFSNNTRRDLATWKELNNDSRQPLFNRALREATAPGETFDVVIAAAALEHELYAGVDERTAGGSGACERASIRTALKNSCDAVFTKMAADLGESQLRETAEKFGFNWSDPKVPVRTNAGTFDGDGITATPLQMARVTAALADGGRLAAPHLVEQSSTGEARQIVSAKTAESLRSALQDKTEWTPTDAGEGNPSSWSLAYARKGNGDLVALAVRVTGQDAGAAALVAEKMAGAVS
ncbi:penicillin-binding transpeptidase domain-containing protein [Streptomyces sp. NBC_01615]|uniref:penicillin-binding transpeptidase domain-containing protein n=1 Tax=Streptomyces sp. NBC_01615 TaxID=2975898 RepID=UPI0038663E99